jgi:hypothetical protein
VRNSEADIPAYVSFTSCPRLNPISSAQWVSGLPVAQPMNPVLQAVADVVFPVISSAIEEEGNKV